MTGYTGTFAISWAQSELDGLTDAPQGALQVGVTWSWGGEAVRLDGRTSVLVLGEAQGAEVLRRRAARAARKVTGAELETIERPGEPDEPLLDRGFAITDGRRQYTVTMIERETAPPLLLFLGDMPMPGTELWVTHVMTGKAHVNRILDMPANVICFTPETLVATPDGPCPVAELHQGDMVLTRDDGPQPVIWRGERRMSGARLFAMPELRPVRIRAGAVGMETPDADLLVSPDHRMMLKGDVARALFNETEVLVRARDMLNDRSIVIDHRVRHVTYVHLLFDQHQIVWANGLESESFHPASMSLDAIEPHQRAELIELIPELERDTSLYGGFARRSLTTSEAAIMLYERAGAH